MGEQQLAAAAIKRAAVAGVFLERQEILGGARPLLEEARALHLEGLGERLI